MLVNRIHLFGNNSSSSRCSNKNIRHI